MEIWTYMRGALRLQIVSADICATVSRLINSGVRLHRLKYIDPLTARITVSRHDYEMVTKICTGRGDQVEILAHLGLYWSARRFLQRPVMVLGMLFLLFLTVFLPTRALFFRVEGNINIPSNMILEKAEQCGLSFGCSTRALRSEKIKNSMLQNLPQLQWVGINTQGCVVTICVREKSQVQINQTQTGVSSLVALRDGVVDSATALDGELKCQPGQSVMKGQVLISGYMELGTHIRGTVAKGEVFAHTIRNLNLLFPLQRTEKTTETHSEEKYSLIIGKKQINFYKGSGISPQCCDKIRTVTNVTLPGGFLLPISIVKITVVQYKAEEQELDEGLLHQQLSSNADRYLQSQMIAGTAKQRTVTWQNLPGALLMKASYNCHEMIAVTHKEEITEFYE